MASTTTGARPKIETMQVEEEHEASGTFTYGTKGAYAGSQNINSFPDKYMQRTNFHIQAYSATFDEEGGDSGMKHMNMISPILLGEIGRWFNEFRALQRYKLRS